MSPADIVLSGQLEETPFCEILQLHKTCVNCSDASCHRFQMLLHLPSCRKGSTLLSPS